jgi:hypothetical protein
MPFRRRLFTRTERKPEGYQGKFGTAAPSDVAERFKTDVRMLP